MEQIDPRRIAEGFAEHCIKMGWLIREGEGPQTKYFVTEEGKEALRRFGIQV
jgi:hypothetical protein